MSDQKLRDFLKNGAPPVPESGPQEYQLIMRRIRHEEGAHGGRSWQLWTVFGMSAAVLSLLLTFTWQEERNVEEDLYRDLDNAEWVQTHQSDAYSDWLQLAEYSSVE
jgi:hypothetical protein